MEYRISKFLKYFVIGLAFAVAVGLIVMLLWNWLIPDIFGGPAVTFLQAIGLLILAKILFGSTGPARVRTQGARQRHHARPVPHQHLEGLEHGRVQSAGQALRSGTWRRTGGDRRRGPLLRDGRIVVHNGHDPPHRRRQRGLSWCDLGIKRVINVVGGRGLPLSEPPSPDTMEPLDPAATIVVVQCTKFSN